MPTSDKSTGYLLVGAGCFGASTALYLKRAYPAAKVTLIDRTPFPCPSAAAHDLNKVIRAEYEDQLYMKLALQAQELWRSDPILKPYYHETGILFTGAPGPGQTVIENYKAVVGDSPAVLLDPEDARARFDGIFQNADWRNVSKCIWNPRAGWGEAENALRSVVQAAVDLGVNYISATVSNITFDESGACTGVRTEDDQLFGASHTVLCTGAYTAQLIANSAPKRKELQVNGRIVAAAAIMCTFRVPQDQMAKFRAAPIIISPIGELPGESIPPGPAGLIKCTHELSFTNKIYHKLSEQTISVPPQRTSQMTWSQDVPQGLKTEVQKVRQMIYGSWVEGLEPEAYRMCWDGVTPNQDFIISPHPHSKDLFIAGGGSFHGWKFLANIGSYVVQMLTGELDEEKTRRWAWDRSDDGMACAVYVPSRDLKDISGYTA